MTVQHRKKWGDELETKTPDEKETQWSLIGGVNVVIIIVFIVLFFLFIKPRMGGRNGPEEPPKEEPPKPTDVKQDAYSSQQDQYQSRLGDTPQQQEQQRYPPFK